MKIIKRLAIIFIICYLLLYFAGTLWQAPLKYYDYAIFNDNLVDASDMAYSSGAIMVQLDWFCDNIGAEVSRNKGKITINWRDKELIIKPYSKKATLNGEALYLDNSPIYKNGKVFAHIRTVTDNLGPILGYSGMTEPSEKIDYSKLNEYRGLCFYTPDYLAAHRVTEKN